MNLNLIPIPKDNVPTTMKILQKYSRSSLAVIYDSLDENREAKMLVQKYVENVRDFTAAFTESVDFFQIVSKLPTAEHTRQVTDILAKIKLSKMDKVLVYANSDDVDMFLSIAKMMQMTGEDYTWILPWNVGRSMETLPYKTMILRPKNTTKTENLFLDALEVIGRGFNDYCKDRTTWSIPSFGCFDSSDHEFGETFFRYSKSLIIHYKTQRKIITETGFNTTIKHFHKLKDECHCALTFVLAAFYGSTMQWG